MRQIIINFFISFFLFLGFCDSVEKPFNNSDEEMKKSVTFPPLFFLGKSFLAENQNVGIIGKGGSEKIVGATFVEFQTFAKFGNGKWKIANGEVRFLNVF